MIVAIGIGACDGVKIISEKTCLNVVDAMQARERNKRLRKQTVIGKLARAETPRKTFRILNAELVSALISKPHSAQQKCYWVFLLFGAWIDFQPPCLKDKMFY